MNVHNCSFFNEDNADTMARLPDGSIDIILTDPPFLYLEDQKLEREFDEKHFFSECKRVLTPRGKLVFFGRGISLYRWALICDEIGLQFKEEVIWDKVRISSPVHPLGRSHELILIFSKKGGVNNARVNVIEKNKHDPVALHGAVRQITRVLRLAKAKEDVTAYVRDGVLEYQQVVKAAHKKATQQTGAARIDDAVAAARRLLEGTKEHSVMRDTGGNAKTYHPTQKPIGLIKRLIELVRPLDKAPEDIILYDPFFGSANILKAAADFGFDGIGSEIDPQYFEDGVTSFADYVEL